MPAPRTAHEATTAARFRAFMIIWVAQLVARIGGGLIALGLRVHVDTDHPFVD